MSNTFLTADCHFGHRGIVTFFREDGVTPERPWNTVEEMDEALVANWNSVVRPKDTIYVLGDFVINRSALHIARRLNGKKYLIKGNHDVLRASEYLEYFEDLLGSKGFDNNILTHIPVHTNQLRYYGGRYEKNCHGHLHSKIVLADIYDREYEEWEYPPDNNYVCVSVEQTNFTPVAYEELKKGFK